MRAEQVRKLADRFDQALRDQLGPIGYGQMIVDNLIETNPSICHSHDHCDSNQVMLDCLAMIWDCDLNDPDLLAPDIWDLALDTIDLAWELWKARTQAHSLSANQPSP